MDFESSIRSTTVRYTSNYFAISFYLGLVFLLFSANACSAAERNPVVSYLEFIVDNDPQLKKALKTNLSAAAKEIPYWQDKTLEDLYRFFDAWLTTPLQPTKSWSGFDNGRIVNYSYVFWNYLDADPGLRVHNSFMGWMALFMNANQQFMYTPQSARYVHQWLGTYPKYMQAFDVPKNGYPSFRAFFLRHLKSGARPIAKPLDGSPAVSPFDCKVSQTYALHRDMVSVKDGRMNILDLLNGNDVAQLFAGGSAYTCNLNLFNYHRFHAPVSGRVVDIGQVGGIYYFDDNFSHLYSHRRAFVVFETEDMGHVALVAVGQVMVNTISLDINTGDTVVKGEELGHFDFGGSEVVMIFQRNFSKMLPEIKSGAVLQLGQAIALSASD